MNYRCYCLTTWSIILPKKLIFAQLIKNLSALHGMWITVLTRAWHLILFWSRWTQPKISHFILFTSLLILSSHLLPGLLKWSLHFTSPDHNSIRISHLFHARYMSHQSHSRFGYPNNILGKNFFSFSQKWPHVKFLETWWCTNMC